MSLHELAGKPAPRSLLANIPRLVSAYYTHTPDASDPDQRVAFGTSGHRGSSLKNSFNERHILSIAQAIAACKNLRYAGLQAYQGGAQHLRKVEERRAAMGAAVDGVQRTLALIATSRTYALPAVAVEAPTTVKFTVRAKLVLSCPPGRLTVKRPLTGPASAPSVVFSMATTGLMPSVMFTVALPDVPTVYAASGARSTITVSVPSAKLVSCKTGTAMRALVAPTLIVTLPDNVV
jgi:hypothetical protein